MNNKVHIKPDAKYIDIHHNDVVNIDMSTKEPASEELEEAAEKYATEGDETSGLFVIKEEADAFIAGANWQKQKDYKKYAHVSLQDIHDAWQELIKNIPDIRSMPAVCFARGADWQKQQLMKDAVEVKIVNCANVASESQDICGKYFSCVGSFKEDEYCPSLGDKVKLIFVKED